MKKFIYLFFICYLLSACNQSQSIDMQKATEEATKFISSQFNFYISGDLELAKNTFYSNAVVIGTDATEFWRGWDAMEPDVKAQLEVIKDAKFDVSNLNIDVSSSGDMAAYTSVVDFSFTAGGEPAKISNVRNSGVVKKIDGKWRITQLHWSIELAGQAVEYEKPE